MIPTRLLPLTLFAFLAQDPAPSKVLEASAQAAKPAGPELVIRDAAGDPMLYLPRDEELVYSVHVGLAFFSDSVGTVTQTSKVEPYRPSVLLGADAAQDEGAESAELKIHAEGSYTLYKLDSTIQAHHHPQVWPRIVYQMQQKGSSQRRRENKIGLYDGESMADYRRDTSKGAPKGTRIWKEPKFRPVPTDTIDMLSSVLACRTLIREGADEMKFPMVEKDRLWELTLKRGERKEVRTKAGTFDAVEILPEPKPWPEEEIDPEKVARFEGLFGMQGAIHLWVDAETGVAVRISGDLPAGPLTLTVDVVLDSFAGTPADFTPRPEPSEAAGEN